MLISRNKIFNTTLCTSKIFEAENTERASQGNGFFLFLCNFFSSFSGRPVIHFYLIWRTEKGGGNQKISARSRPFLGIFGYLRGTSESVLLQYIDQSWDLEKPWNSGTLRAHLQVCRSIGHSPRHLYREREYMSMLGLRVRKSLLQLPSI